MTVFKGFLGVLKKCKGIIILYTAMLLFFGAFSLQTSEENNINFENSKPDVLIINKDENKGVTKNLINYIESNSNIKNIENTGEKISDALFYRDINYVIYIPDGYREDFLNGLNPEIKIKKTGDYNSSYAEMLLTKYLKIANAYSKDITNEDELISKINDTLNENVSVTITSKVNKSELEKATFYYNFANYSILAGLIYVVCLILSSFRNEKIRKRTIISSMNYKKYNRILLLSSMLFAILLWLLYVVISFILIGDIMFTLNGLVYIINSFIFTMCALSLAFLIANLVSDKNAINGIVNVVALGSSFLCGSFVPVNMLPDSVLKIAHILPSYYYIQTNEMLDSIKVTNLNSISNIPINMIVIIIFMIAFVIINNIISKKNRKIG